MGIVIEPKAYISWIPQGKIAVKPPASYITWLPLGKIHLRPLVMATIVPSAARPTTAAADAERKVGIGHEVSADTFRKATAAHVVIADTKRTTTSLFIAWTAADVFRKVSAEHTAAADTRRTLSGVWTAISSDTRRILGGNYRVGRADTQRSVKRSNRVISDTRRVPGIGHTVTGDTFRLVGRGEPIPAPTLRTLVKRETVPADTSLRVPLVLSYAPLMQNFHEHGIRSFSLTLGELTLSDTFTLETVQPMEIDDTIQGQLLDYAFRFLVEETSQRDLVQTVKGMYSKDALFYTPINIFVEEANVSYYAWQIAHTLGLKLHMVCDDFIPSQDYQDSGMTYQDFISSLFGWTSRLPHRQINVFMRGDTLHIVQRGLEKSVVDISDWPHTRPTIERKLVRSIWHGKGNEDGGSKAKSEADDAPLPFTGTISFEDISYTYSDGYLTKEKNENGETAYAYQNEYDRQGKCTGKYVSRKETRNKDGSMSEVEFLYAATANDIYLFKERERRKDPKETPSYTDEWDFERMTYHAPIGCGWYATTVYEDGERVGSSLSQGAPGGKASQYTIDRVNLGFGSHYSSYYDGEPVAYTPLIDTAFPVKGEAYLWELTKAIEWLNRKTQETVAVEIIANIRDGVPDVNHIVDFTERIRFNGSEYFLVSNAVELTPRSLKQTIRMTRWY